MRQQSGQERGVDFNLTDNTGGSLNCVARDNRCQRLCFGDLHRGHSQQRAEWRVHPDHGHRHQWHCRGPGITDTAMLTVSGNRCWCASVPTIWCSHFSAQQKDMVAIVTMPGQCGCRRHVTFALRPAVSEGFLHCALPPDLSVGCKLLTQHVPTRPQFQRQRRSGEDTPIGLPQPGRRKRFRSNRRCGTVNTSAVTDPAALPRRSSPIEGSRDWWKRSWKPAPR